MRKVLYIVVTVFLAMRLCWVGCSAAYAQSEVPAFQVQTPKLQEPKPQRPKRTLVFPLYDTITISFIGDVMQHLPQIAAAKSAAAKSGTATPKYDYTNTFKYIEDRIAEADYMVANIELTIGTPPYSGYPQFSAPPQIVEQAQRSGIDLFMMANNHIADKGAKGLKRTLELYRELGVQTVGVYENPEAEERENPLIVELKGVKFAFFNFTYDTNGLPVPAPYVVCQEDTAHIHHVVQRAKAAGADFIIALPHWGLEYHLKQSEQQTALAEYMLALGVDAIVGGHPHVTQPVTVAISGSTSTSKTTAIFYSLGNYVSNQSRPPQTQTGMFVTLRFRRNRLTGVTEMLQPLWFYTRCYRPGDRLPDGRIAEDYIVQPD